jgi:flagellar hook assembly protein FlgD
LSDTSTSFPIHIDHEGDGVIDITLHAVNAVPGVPAQSGRLALGVPRPNPGRDRFDLTVTVPAPGRSLVARVVDLQGREVRRLATAWYPPGVHSLRWDGRDGDGRTPPSGTYWLMVTSRGETRSAKVTTLH